MPINSQETADMVRFTEEILNGKLHFLCSVHYVKKLTKHRGVFSTLSSILDGVFRGKLLSAANYFHKMLNLRYLVGFWMGL